MATVTPTLQATPATPTRRRGKMLSIGAVLLAALMSVPILGIAWNLTAPGQGNWEHLSQTVLPGYIANSLLLMLGVSVGVGIGGIGTAWLVTMCRFPGRAIFEWALILPLAMPGYVVAYAYTDFLQHAGPVQSALRDLMEWGPKDYWFPQIRSLEGAIIVFSSILYPYVYLLARTAFLEQSICVLEVGRTLGRSALGSFRSIAIPLARPAIVTGIALALMETLADFGTVAHFGVNTFTTGIYRTWASMGDRVAAAQLSSILLAFVLGLLLMEQWSRNRARYHQTSRRYTDIRGYALSGWRAVGAFMFCAMPLAVGFLIPVLVLGWMSATDGHYLLSARYLELTANSVILASITAVIAVAVSLFMAYAARIEKSKLAFIANRVASMGYAIPGSIIAVGILLPVAALDNAISAWARDTFGVSTGLILTGSVFALVFAYLVRFMAVSLNTVQSSLSKITPSMDEAARTLGSGPIRTGWRVHIPILSGGMLTAGLIVFVDVMKELPATLIMRPFNFDTLAVQAYNLAKDERLTQAATPSLVIVACGMIPVILISRAIMSSRPGAKKKPR